MAPLMQAVCGQSASDPGQAAEAEAEAEVEAGAGAEAGATACHGEPTTNDKGRKQHHALACAEVQASDRPPAEAVLRACDESNDDRAKNGE